IAPIPIRQLCHKCKVQCFHLKELECARKKLGIDRGIYRVSMNILEAAKKAGRTRSRNENSKAFRSLIVPGVLALFVYACKQPYPHSLILGGLAALLGYISGWIVYPLCKNSHRRMLYAEVAALTDKKLVRISSGDPKDGTMISFFWDGTLVATGIKATPRVQKIEATLPDSKVWCRVCRLMFRKRGQTPLGA